MCWTSRKNRNTKIADKNIPVFKICRISRADDKVYPFYQYFNGKSSQDYRENTVYDCDAIHFAIKKTVNLYSGGVTYSVNHAIHSYSLDNIRLSTSIMGASICIKTDKTTPEAQDVICRAPHYDSTYVAIMLCTIPKGTRYAINEVGEVVSDTIEVNKIIRNPFTFNKDTTISKRSVEMVNKILDEFNK